MILTGWEDEETPGTCEDEEEGVGIPEGSKVGVNDGVSAAIESTLTSGEVSVGAILLLPSSSRVNSTSIHQISMEEDGVTFISLAWSRGTPAY